MLASRLNDDPATGATIPDDPAYLSAVTGCKITRKSLDTLVSCGFLAPCKHDASNLHTNACLETEVETETEAEVERTSNFESQSRRRSAPRNGERTAASSSPTQPHGSTVSGGTISYGV